MILKKRAFFLIALAPWITFFHTQPANADFKADLSKVYEMYNKGAYTQAIETLSKLHPTSSNENTLVEYWKGLCYNRVQSFDQAIDSFKKAIQSGASFNDMYYELGQALYASQQLKLALKAFSKSVSQNHKMAASTYYIGFIYQLLEDYKNAYKNYRTLIELPNDSENLKQSALFQIGELKLILALDLKQPEIKKEKLKDHVLPIFESVLNYNPKTALAEEAKVRIAQIKAEVDKQTPGSFENGAPMPARPWLVRVTEDVKYDTNVVTRANDSILQVGQASSFLFRTDAYGKYDWFIGRKWAISPEISTSHTHYTNQTEPFAFQNENINTTFAIKNRLEHFFSGKPAGFNVNFEMNYFMRDWRYEHSLPFYSRYYSVTVLERLPLFSFGATSISGNFKLFSAADPNLNAMVPTVSVTQNIQLNPRTALSVALLGDYNRAALQFWDRKDLRLTTTCNITKLFLNLDATVVFDFTLVDTMYQSATRGLEKTISPSLILTRSFMNGAFINVTYGYVNNISMDQQNFAYSKSMFGIGAGYYF